MVTPRSAQVVAYAQGMSAARTVPPALRPTRLSNVWWHAMEDLKIKSLLFGFLALGMLAFLSVLLSSFRVFPALLNHLS